MPKFNGVYKRRIWKDSQYNASPEMLHEGGSGLCAMQSKQADSAGFSAVISYNI